jgi:hypothetical protein
MKIMNGMFAVLGRLSLGEFIVIWTSTILVVSYYLFLLYHLIRLQKDVNLLKTKMAIVLGLAKDVLKDED